MYTQCARYVLLYQKKLHVLHYQSQIILTCWKGERWNINRHHRESFAPNVIRSNIYLRCIHWAYDDTISFKFKILSDDPVQETTVPSLFSQHLKTKHDLLPKCSLSPIVTGPLCEICTCCLLQLKFEMITTPVLIMGVPTTPLPTKAPYYLSQTRGWQIRAWQTICSLSEWSDCPRRTNDD